MTTDEKTIEEIRFRTLVETYGEIVKEVCRRYSSGDKALCNDLIQEVLIVIWLHINSFPATASTIIQKHWVKTVARQTATNYLRKEHNTVSLDDISEAESPTVEMESDSGFYELLRTALTDEEQWLAVHLAHGYKVDELAKMLNVTRSAVYKQLGIIRQKIKARQQSDN